MDNLLAVKKQQLEVVGMCLDAGDFPMESEAVLSGADSPEKSLPSSTAFSDSGEWVLLLELRRGTTVRACPMWAGSVPETGHECCSWLFGFP